MKDGEMIDKDKVHNLFDSGLLDDPHCIGPQGIRMGGRSRPGVRPNLPFNVTDHGTKIWLIMCQDECCVHTLKEEQYAWIIPGLEMGDMPTKSDGDLCHLSEADAEFGCGCLSLVGKPGWISRKQLVEYIRAKRAGENPLIPHYSTVHMHAGKGNGKEGSWEGDDANMHFELMMDQFDILFNLVHRVCVQDVCHVSACMHALHALHVLHGTGPHPPTPLIMVCCRWLTHHWLVQMILLTSHVHKQSELHSNMGW